MEKIKLSFRSPKTKIVEYNGLQVEVRPFINIVEQKVLIETYLETYFDFLGEGHNLLSRCKYDYISAEYNLIHSIFHMLTNVDSESFDTDLYDGTKLWKDVKGEIRNYDEFYERLQRTVSDMKEQLANENSAGVVLKELSDKAANVLDQFAKITPEEVEKTKEAGLALLEGMEKSDTKKVFKDMKLVKKTKAA